MQLRLLRSAETDEATGSLRLDLGERQRRYMQLRLLRSAETNEATESLRLDGVGDNVAICICAKTWNVKKRH